MRNSILIITSCLLLTSCFKMPKDPYISPLKVPESFDWKSIEAKKVTITQVSSVLNENGDTVASFLPPGDYDLTIGNTDKYSASCNRGVMAFRKSICAEQDIIDCYTEVLLTLSRYLQINDWYKLLITKQN